MRAEPIFYLFHTQCKWVKIPDIQIVYATLLTIMFLCRRKRSIIIRISLQHLIKYGCSHSQEDILLGIQSIIIQFILVFSYFPLLRIKKLFSYMLTLTFSIITHPLRPPLHTHRTSTYIWITDCCSFLPEFLLLCCISSPSFLLVITGFMFDLFFFFFLFVSYQSCNHCHWSSIRTSVTICKNEIGESVELKALTTSINGEMQL